MKRNVLAVSIAAMIGGLGFAGGASAIVGNGVAVPTTATVLEFNENGTGHILIVPYYTVQSNFSTLLNIVNTDTTNAKAVKVRFRGAANSDDIFDFTVFMSPGDVWAANISSTADGIARLTTADKSCTLPYDLGGGTFVTDRLSNNGTATDKAVGTREGYIEILNMADIAPGYGLYTTTKHVAGVAPCQGFVFQLLATDPATIADAENLGFRAPTGGLFANWTVINVPETTVYSGSAAAVEARVAANGLGGTGKIVFHPQTVGTLSLVQVEDGTADPLLRAAAGSTLPTMSPTVASPVKINATPSMFDLPDLSTPYTVDAPASAAGPVTQAAKLSRSLAVTSVTNEYLLDPAISAKTDWVFSQPTRRYSAAVDYNNKTTWFTSFTAAVGYAGNQYYTSTNTQLSGDILCLKATAIGLKYWDREETTVGQGPTLFQVSPGTAPAASIFCGEDAVVTFVTPSTAAATDAQKKGALYSTLAHSLLPTPYNSGWASASLVGATGSVGLPVLGGAYVKAVNPAVSAGVSGNFGAYWQHRTTRVPVVAPGL